MPYDIHTMTRYEEFKACERLQADVLGFEDLDVVPYQLLQSFATSGGAVIGAFDGNVLIGAVMGYTGLLASGKPYHRSQRLAVLPRYRGQGVGEELKQAQADLARGYKLDLMCWTYDPLRSVNAQLNIRKLGATSCRYIEHAYAASTSPRDTGASIDRLWIEWDLKKGTGRRGDVTDQASVLLRDENGLPSQPDFSNLTRILVIQIPPDIDAVRALGNDRLVAWRNATRDAFTRCFAHGYRITDYVRGQGYILTKMSDDRHQ